MLGLPTHAVAPYALIDDDDSNEEEDEGEGRSATRQRLNKPIDEPGARRSHTIGFKDEGARLPDNAISDDEGEILDTAVQKPGSTRDSKPGPVRRTYFADTSKAAEKSSTDHFAGIQNGSKKTAQLGQPKDEIEDDAREGETEEAHQARLKRLAQMLAQQDRDLEEMDMGLW
ncbi:hypothetical protein LTR17_013225 [Elasticomyces elasticus]|nr:hypothetical protein LTR17_013225 [Elasticomyces elasticus]